MTMLMDALHRRLPWNQRYPLPPSLITSRLEKKLFNGDRPSADNHEAIAAAAHFGYGAAAGALYACTAARSPAPDPLKGTASGLLLWFASYFGLLPALGLMRPANAQPEKRRFLMIAAHILWGIVAARMLSALERATDTALAKPVASRRTP
jgi:hypothetical protein